MGQAKQRGTKEQRIAQAQAKIEALRPEKLVCGACETAFNDFNALDTRNMAGIHVAFGGICPSCGETVLAFSGDQGAVAAAMIAWQDATGSDGKLGMQSRVGEHIPFKD
ncbi:TPA: hypothetical protein QDC20_000325 [Burkholderia aenigmatica]|uniref:hypothetical protein n=1 Tax=Burkholderia sp. AU45251 TaxID=3059204 RepID=UPI0026506759|nr:hypothetical protein [Burkholderia sp. AU45251]HDR9483226.1 hypothetical protein [Burkholderia aenigmatica]MDN7516091.1 hypothetical protein [Burkholderia sp. AU45251]HDR9514174.1 hypothetical protein [Burkholderia aenigmatica]HDR9591564.1 hypothetical protein [Burkholderia aenigmatica]HDR9598656.1 hypothetical protein [Burkholderia aenigmatica]